MSKRYRYIYISEDMTIAKGDSPKPKGSSFNCGIGRTIIDTLRGTVWDGSDWEKIPVDNESESSD